jgi:uncharacterized membrane protein
MSEPTRGLSRIPFTRADEEKLKSLATWMTIYGIFMAVGAAYALSLFVVGAINGQIHWPILVQSIVGGLVAGWALQGAAAFRQVVTTDVADQDAIVTGLRKLYALFLLKALYILVGILLPIAVLLAVLVLSAIKGR